ncbi:phosphatase PAP2 family protein [Roseateles albus]|uniref:Phosphatase PAP2 family protein n=1 Tax=Roseateles albus TaxID=2987525 RepID=A0ABT5KJQ3_9BURK|nr:phosphatase PAP2 family protein [Roseateles albus]
MPWSQSGFPPYGAISRHYRIVTDHTLVPAYFKVDGAAANAAQWQGFIDTNMRDMSDFLWPEYDRARGAWVGAAIAQMESLTRADLDLMVQLRAFLPREAAVEVIPGGEPVGLARSHLDLFKAEDESAKPTLAVYLPMLSTDLQALVTSAVGAELEGFPRAHIAFKQRFQRPRPYQMSFLLDPPGATYAYQFASSAVTPSMVSGHCFSGILARAGALVAKLEELEVSLHAVASMQQYMVDIGDRRVFAGVHYPSDNLGSWFLSLRLCKHLFGGAGQVAKDLIWQAISERSIVFKAMNAAVQASARSPFAEPMRRLRVEAALPVT